MSRPFRTLARSLRDFYSDGGVTQAAAIAYFAMMTMVPFLIFLFSLLGFFLGGAAFNRFFFSRIIYYFPQGTGKMAFIVRSLIHYRKAGLLSLLVYGLISYGLFLNLEKAMNIVFKVKKGRHILHSFFLVFVVISVIGALMLLSFALAGFDPIFSYFGRTLKLATVYSVIIKYIVPGSLLFAVSLALYVFLPARKIRISQAAWGALFTSAMIEAAKHFFAFYIKSIFRTGHIYGPLSAFMFFLLWVFYSSCIFIVGGEIAYNTGPHGRG